MHFPALLCMYSLSDANAASAARLRQISHSVCKVTAELTATLNHWENINVIASFSLPLQLSCSSSPPAGASRGKGQTKSVPEPDDFIGQQTVREQTGNAKAQRQPKCHQLRINSTGFNLLLWSRCEIALLNGINCDYVSQMRSKSKWERAK